MRHTGEQQQRFDAMLDRVLVEREKYGDRIRIIATRIYDEYEYASPEACHHAISKGLSKRRISVKSKPDFVEKSPPGLISTDAVDDQGDIVYLTIEEWKQQYGLPGSGGAPDQNGRINGYFPTEPDYCEDANLFDTDETNETEQTGEAA
jgi:hypothetical protein